VTTVKELMERVSTIIAEDPDRASEFGGVYKFVLDGDEGRTLIVDRKLSVEGDRALAMKLENLDEMGDCK
jgi:hypothetical protein